MARARLLKPGFFTNDKLCELPALTRLLFAGLWTIADREGRLEDRPKRIGAEVLPYDDMDVDVALTALEGAGFISRYEAEDGRRAIQITAFSKHQHVHVREPASDIPGQHRSSTGLAPVEHRTGPAEAEAEAEAEADTEAEALSGVEARAHGAPPPDDRRATEPIPFPVLEDIPLDVDPVADMLVRRGIPLTAAVRDDLEDYQRRGIPDDWLTWTIRAHPDKPWNYLTRCIETTIRNGGPQEANHDRDDRRRMETADGRGSPRGRGPAHGPAVGTRDDPYDLRRHSWKPAAGAAG